MLSVMNGERQGSLVDRPAAARLPRRRSTRWRAEGLRVLHIPTMGNPEVDHDVARLMAASLDRLRDAGASSPSSTSPSTGPSAPPTS
jgi:hypothetical protein